MCGISQLDEKSQLAAAQFHNSSPVPNQPVDRLPEKVDADPEQGAGDQERRPPLRRQDLQHRVYIIYITYCILYIIYKYIYPYLQHRVHPEPGHRVDVDDPAEVGRDGGGRDAGTEPAAREVVADEVKVEKEQRHHPRVHTVVQPVR